MSKKLLFKISYLKKSILLLAILFMASTSDKSNASSGDTMWVTTFNQNFQNWADIHYQNFLLPDTATHYKQILMYYTIGCPSAGCDPWDRLGWIQLYKDSLTKYEIARVITPYNIVGSGYPGQCVFVFDVTDYMPLLHDSVRLGSYIESWIGGVRGWLVTVKFAYIEGEIQNKPVQVINLWQNNHVLYGDPSVPPENYLTPQTVMIDPQTSKAKVRLTTTGHGQGNTENSAEFSYKIHQVVVGNDITDQTLWRSDCSTNPCSPQGGSWTYPRAGWCPGASVIPFEVDATNSVIPGQNVIIDYNLQAYENFCRPNNVNCISGQTCSDCNYNNNGHTEPHYTIQGQLILYKNNPLASLEIISSQIPESYNLEQNYPNPFNPSTKINFNLPKASNIKLSVYDIQGKLLKTLVEGELTAGSYSTEWSASDYPSGIYIYRIEADGYNSSKRMMLVK
ncbi:MAG: T9SS type A sorting domain-containing protein [Bacteroidota bacterium]|nr:T9SS type A sorting domain-containing protein [Bacteroidota bacterium]